MCPLCVRPLHQQPLCVALVFSSLLSVGAKLFPAPGKQGVVGWAWAVTLAPLWELCDPGGSLSGCLSSGAMVTFVPTCSGVRG